MKMEKIAFYLKIEKDIKEKIKKGEWKPGTKLPPEYELASYYKVSRTTLRKALRFLISEGYIYQVPGRGTFVTSPDDKNIEIIKKRRNYLMKMNKGIGVLIPCVTETLFPGIVRGVEDVCKENGYHILLGNYDVNPEKEREYMETFVQRGVSGLVISPSFNSYLNPYYQVLKRREIPFVLTDVTVEGVEADLVATDNFKGAYLGTKHLISLGCKKIAYLSGWLDVSSSKERFSGFKAAMEEAGILINHKIIKTGNFSSDFGYKATKEILSSEKIDGIFSANEPITIGVLKAIKEFGYKLLENIKIVSFDEPVLPPGLNFPITLIKQPRYEIGKVAAELLLERIEEKEITGYRKILLEPEIIETGEKEVIKTKRR